MPQKSLDKTAYDQHKEAVKERNREITFRGQNIPDIPPPKYLDIREKADKSFKFFCEYHFPDIFYLPWSKDHLRVIDKIEQVILNYETLAMAMPRGGGKSALCKCALIWGAAKGLHKFIMYITAEDTSATARMDEIKIMLETNDRLNEQYPEICAPIRALDGESRRANGQRYHGFLTRIEWGSDEIVLPTIPGSLASGTVISVKGILMGSIRGSSRTLASGKILRPTLAIVDDPQTDGSAKSFIQTTERLKIINGTISGLSGPDEEMGVIIPCTVIEQDDLSDQLVNRDKNPSWRGERIKMMPSMPVNANLWEQYRDLRDSSLKDDGDGHEAAVFYKKNMADCGKPLDVDRRCSECKRYKQCMDADAITSWIDRYVSKKGELSAVQHAMYIKFKYGDEAFASEYQNEPRIKSDYPEDMITAEAILARCNGRTRGEIPLECTKITAFVDIHKELLYWLVVAWKDDFTGYVIDYGTMPDQNKRIFALAGIKRGLSTIFPGHGEEATIQLGLERVIKFLMQKEWSISGGDGVMRIDRILVDMGYKPKVAEAVKHKIGGNTMVLSKGVGIRAGNKPISTYQKRVGWQIGHHWYMPSVIGTREFPHICVDTNFWKTFLCARLGVSPGDPGALTLFGRDSNIHHLLAAHVANSEYYTITSGHGRTLQEWRERPERNDNHYLDCLSNCCAGASTLGLSLPGEDVEPVRKRKKYTQEDLRRRKT